MNAVESVAALAELLRNNLDRCTWTGALGPEDVARAEEQLGVAFPPSYRRFLAELGSCEAEGEEFLGVYRTGAMGDVLLGTVSETLHARSDPRFPQHLLVVQYDGMGGLVSIDVSLRDGRGESPVVVWDPGAADRGGPELLAEDFGSHALRQCTRALGR
ncbi:SMI1/KNR4 family protein [Streptacidiphilus sp. ASG 303]|uniref:SMI1/KNR4 family protein n=1 Tax=Streptacidiphilus sp. ASG 303 TaxID=2896847 RepID=UPI001E5A9B27|nr:SMI1/KNR4 family protein [Streptacidiphilus sp. ASG 303]MCD0484577.1 SMI1/KNR4 family protein [Streptacidiphilus sp. ASG 303]